jgi:tetratricopeptide (TPR) repeat protein
MLAKSRIPRVLMLSVFRDGTLHGQAELTAQGLRIGRGSENDIVLEDAAKRVSRLHAELRLEEDGAITLTDLRSSNGTWIAGERIDTEALEPGVPFTIGPYRLMLEDFADSSAADFTPDHVAGEPSIAPSLAQPADSLPQAPASAAARQRGDAAGAQGPWKAAAGLRDLAIKHRWATIIGGGATVAIAGLGIWSMRGDASSAENPPTEAVATTPPATVTPPPPDPHAQHLDEADRLLVQGDKTSAETALRDHINPVLQADPTNARALEQKGVADRIISPVPPPVGPPTQTGPTPSPRPDVRPVDPRTAQHLQRLGEARAAVDRGDYRSALAVLGDLLAEAPDFGDGKALQQRALALRAEAARRQVAEAEELVKAGRLPEAIDAFRRAVGIDPSVSVAPRIAEVGQRMQQEGEAAFLDGMNYAQAMRGDQAIPLLQKAWRYLPDGHRDKPTVRSELQRLGAPVR